MTTELFPKTKAEGDEIDKIIGKLQDNWFDYDRAQGRVSKGGKDQDQKDYDKYRTQMDKDLKRLRVLFGFK